MNKQKYLIVLLILFASAVYAHQGSYLISVDLQIVENRQQLEEIDLAVYHVSGDVLIAGLSTLEIIEREDIPFHIIDDKAWSEKYYLLSVKKGEMTTDPILWGEEIYRDSNISILKTEELSVERIIEIPFEITELFPIPLNYPFRTVYPPRRSGMPVNRIEVDQLLNTINPDSLGYFVQTLEDFVTRFCFAANRDQVASWIENEFLRFGYTDVVIDSFYQQGVWHKNVVATIPGTVNPDQVVIIGGHHDSIIFSQYGNPMNIAPGADDNATGTAAALEIARAIKAVDFQPETTIRFITFAAEEVGLWGSHHYAQSALDQGMNIKLMLNNDMIGHTLQQNPDNWTIHLIEYAGFENEANLARQIIGQYTNITPVTNTYNSPSSDSYAFWIRGFPAIFFIETNFNPYYHSPNDLFIHLDMDYAAETVKATAAIAALINVVPDSPSDFTVIDAGNGSELILQWSESPGSLIDIYEVYVGLSSGNYSTTFTTEETSFILSGLEEGVTYYIGLAAIGLSGYSSVIVEQTGVPWSVPITPQNFFDLPHPERIDLSWSPNLEADLAGYNLYRSETEGDLGEQLNQEVIEGNSYFDIDVEGGVYYYYSLTAVDETGNESDPTEQLRSRIITLDQGVLIVADTPDGNGSFQNPTLQSITQFYNQILSSYAPDIYPLWSVNDVKLADLGAYSTVIWHKNNASSTPYNQQRINAIKQYLDSGGNILISTYFPGRILAGSDSYPADFQEGDFIFDYFKVNQIQLQAASRFFEAQPLVTGYPLLPVDHEKTPVGINHHLLNIESISAVQPGADIYSYRSDYPGGSPEASMNGMPVGIEYLGDNYKAVLLSFPLYYMEQQAATALMNYVMSEKFGEPTDVTEEELLPETVTLFTLHSNFPNPFNPETVIRFTLRKESEINLSVYNLRGQRVKVIADGKKEAGEHFTAWNGRDETGREVASGIYFYRLTTEFGQKVRKMLLVK